MKKNILLTTLGNTFNYSRHNYYTYEAKGIIKYCEGISNAEAGAKYILSKVPVDKIIVLGPSSAFKDENIDHEIALRDFGEYSAMDPSKYSEYKFFCYRIMQFLNRVDIEGDDILQEITSEKKKEVLEIVRSFCEQNNIESDGTRKFDQLFHIMNSDQEQFERLCLSHDDFDGTLQRWLKHYLYMVMNREYKMNTLSSNEEITVQFVPTIRKGQSSLRMGNLLGILDYIVGGGKEEVNLFVDLQGMDIADSHTLINVLFMIQNEHAQAIHIDEIITTTYRPLLFTSPIEDQKTRLELSELLSGMDAFLQYGKVDSMKKYWLSRNIQDEHIDRLIYAMQTVDVGITLCSVSDIERGIRMLQMVFADESNPSTAIEGMIFHILENGIKYDYGKLLRGDDVDILALVKWAVKKHFYQQALTIIESRVPYDIVRNGIVYYARNEEEKMEFMDRLNEQYWKTQLKDRYQFDDLNHYYVKYFRRREAYKNKTERPMETYVKIRMDEIFDPDSEQKAYTIFRGERALLEQFILNYIEIGNIRNQISHAQEVDIVHEAWKLGEQNVKIQILQERISEFVDLYERVRQEVHEQDNNVHVITQEEFYVYRNEHPIKWNEFREKKRNTAKDN